MITVFNRRELYSTYSIEEQGRIREILSSAGIDYLVDSNSGMARNIGAGPIAVDRFGSNPLQFVQYRIFVRKKDYDRAAGALNK